MTREIRDDEIEAIRTREVVAIVDALRRKRGLNVVPLRPRAVAPRTSNPEPPPEAA